MKILCSGAVFFVVIIILRLVIYIFSLQLFPKKLRKKAARHNLRGRRAVVGKMNASHF